MKIFFKYNIILCLININDNIYYLLTFFCWTNSDKVICLPNTLLWWFTFFNKGKISFWLKSISKFDLLTLIVAFWFLFILFIGWSGILKHVFLFNSQLVELSMITDCTLFGLLTYKGLYNLTYINWCLLCIII